MGTPGILFYWLSNRGSEEWSNLFKINLGYLISWASAFCRLLCCHLAVCVFLLCSLSYSYLVLAHRYQLLMLQSKPKNQNLRIKINSVIWLNQSHFQFIFIGDWAREKKSKTKSLVSEGKVTLVSLARLLILRMWLQIFTYLLSNSRLKEVPNLIGFPQFLGFVEEMPCS